MLPGGIGYPYSHAGKMDSRVPEKDVTDLKDRCKVRVPSCGTLYSTKRRHTGFGGKYVFAAMYQFLREQINKNNKEK